jgi:hydrogenase maturation factor
VQLAESNYRDPEMAKRIAQKIAALTPKTGTVKICHVCGTHEWTISHYGIRSFLRTLKLLLVQVVLFVFYPHLK